MNFQSQWGEGNTRPHAMETWRLQLGTSQQRANAACWGSNESRPTSAARAEKFFEWVRGQKLYYRDIVAADSIHKIDRWLDRAPVQVSSPRRFSCARLFPCRHHVCSLANRLRSSLPPLPLSAGRRVAAFSPMLRQGSQTCVQCHLHCRQHASGWRLTAAALLAARLCRTGGSSWTCFGRCGALPTLRRSGP